MKLILFNEEAAVIFNHITPLKVSRSMKHGSRERERRNRITGSEKGGKMLKGSVGVSDSRERE